MVNKVIPNLPVSWAEIEEGMRSIAIKLHDHYPDIIRNWRVIAPVARGGLVPASILAQAFDIRYIDTICVTSRDERNRPITPIFDKFLAAKTLALIGNEGEGLVVVEDLTDDGHTLCAIHQMLTLYPRVTYVTFCTKPAGAHYVTFTHRPLRQGPPWLDFPWERKFPWQKTDPAQT